MNPAIIAETRFNALIDRTKRHLLSCGPNVIRHFARIVESGGKGCDPIQVNKETFTNAAKEAGILLTEEEVNTVFIRLDRTGLSYSVDPEEFSAALRYDFSQLREVWLFRVWESFPKTISGSILLKDMQTSFRPEGHPLVIRGKQSTEAVRESFFSSFNTDLIPSGVVTRQDFEQFYGALSSTIFDDETYLAILRGCWPIPHANDIFTKFLAEGSVQINCSFSAFQCQHEADEITRYENLKRDLERTIRHQHRPMFKQSPLLVRQLTMSFQCYDHRKLSGFISKGDFFAALREYRIYLDNEEVLEVLDTNGDGTVDYYYYLGLLLPRLPPMRRVMLERMWRKVMPPKDREGAVEVLAFQRCFHAKNGEEQNMFYFAWDVQKVVGRKVRFWEVEHWYIPQSMGIERDADFEAKLALQWPGYTFAADRSTHSST